MKLGIYILILLFCFSSNGFPSNSQLEKVKLKLKTSDFKAISKDLNFKKGLSKSEFLIQINQEIEKLKGNGVNEDSAEFEEDQIIGADDSVERRILVITCQGGWEYEVLIYEKQKDNWELVKLIPVFSKNEGPEIEVKSFKDMVFLILTSSGGGSGVETLSDEIYLLESNNIKKVLDYSSSGFNYNCFDGQVGYRWETSNLEFLEGNGIKAKVSFLEKYFTAGDCAKESELSLLEVKTPLEYYWDKDKKIFISSPKNKKDFEELDAGLFLKHFFNDLKKIAAGPDEDKKKWLKCFCNLEEVRETAKPEADRILEVLKK
jgi:hypothetical protein